MLYRDYLESDHWQSVRQRFWASKLPKRCELCWTRDAQFDLHHKYGYGRKGEEKLLHLALLCRDCHYNVHFDNGVKVSLDYKHIFTRFKVLKRRRKKGYRNYDNL